MRWLVVAMLLAGCQGPVSTRAEFSQLLSTDRPIEFIVPIWTFRF